MNPSRRERRARVRRTITGLALSSMLLGVVAQSEARAQETTATEAPASTQAPAPTPAPEAPAPTPTTAAAPPADSGVIDAPTPAAVPAKAPGRKATKRRAATQAAAPRTAARGGTSIEVDISSQRLYLYKGGTLYRTVSVSTGSGRRYCNRGSCSTAYTPRGRFRIYSRISGWRTASLGRLYNPLYFSGGFAIHGGNIPGYPASHGCVRIPMSAARWFPGAVPNGTPVYIHN